MNYLDILRNEHFNNIAAIVRVPFQSANWRDSHVMPFWSRLAELDKLRATIDKKDGKSAFVTRFCGFLLELTEVDPRLAYTQDDLAWFIESMDSDQAMPIAALLFAWFSAPDEMLTPAEVAARTETHESGWRNKAAAGEIPGAIKKGKQWLLPRSVLRSRGLPV